jgi:uncharacterized membrane protein (DUF106 family)
MNIVNTRKSQKALYAARDRFHQAERQARQEKLKRLQAAQDKTSTKKH